MSTHLVDRRGRNALAGLAVDEVDELDRAHVEALTERLSKLGELRLVRADYATVGSASAFGSVAFCSAAVAASARLFACCTASIRPSNSA